MLESFSLFIILVLVIGISHTIYRVWLILTILYEEEFQILENRNENVTSLKSFMIVAKRVNQRLRQKYL